MDKNVCRRMLAMLDHIHRLMEAEDRTSLTYKSDLFNEVGCLIAEAKGDYNPSDI